MKQTPKPIPPPTDAASGTTTRRQKLRAKFLARSRAITILYMLMLPTLLSMAVISYYPKLDVIVKSFYRWTPGFILEYQGVKNYQDALADPLFWQSFKVVAIMLVANLFKMWPGIIVAVAMHRLHSAKSRYVYQVMFVIPMVIPGLVWLLIWKSFFEPDFGILNKLLQMTGLIHVLDWLDGSRQVVVTDAVTAVTEQGQPITEQVQATQISGGMPAVAEWLNPIIYGWYELNDAGQRIIYHATGEPNLIFPGLEQLVGGVWLIFFFGAVLLALLPLMSSVDDDQEPGATPSTWPRFLAVLGASAVPWVVALLPGAGLGGAIVMAVLAIGAMVWLSKSLGTKWVIWPFIILYGTWAGYHELWRLPVFVAAAMALVLLLTRLRHLTAASDITRWIGYACFTVASLLVVFGMIWVTPTQQFDEGTPAWLGNQYLVLPSLIMWGFPWVGTVGVLIYLAGLQQISQDVYEAAELDGVGPIGKLFHIELPLIMTQVRINLIFMTIATLTGYEFYLILLGADGGPGNVGIVPGLYMYNQSFLQSNYGYACALGMVLFVMILLLTVVYQRYVKVEK